MFAKDYYLLNEIYNQKIVSEMNLGPHGDNQDVTPTPNQITKINLPKKQYACGKEHAAKSEDCEGYDPNSYNSNGKMARQLLFRMFKLSAMLHDVLKGKDNVEAWVLSKLTNAHDQLESVFGYEDYEKALNPAHGACGDIGNSLEEANEEDLFAAIAKGGDDIVSSLQKVLRNESKETLEKVLLETILILEKKK